MNQIDVRIVVGLWLAIMITVVGAFGFFRFSKTSAQTKRRVFGWYIGVGGVLIALWFMLLIGLPGLLIVIVAYPPTAYLSIRVTRFCDACGATQFNQFIRAHFCSHCGADRDAQVEQR